MSTGGKKTLQISKNDIHRTVIYPLYVLFLSLCEFVTLYPLPHSPPVPSGGENSSEALAGVCGVLRVQRAAADRSHHLCGHKERYNKTEHATSC